MKRVLSILVVLSMLISMLGTALPVLADTTITVDGDVSDWTGMQCESRHRQADRDHYQA